MQRARSSHSSHAQTYNKLTHVEKGGTLSSTTYARYVSEEEKHQINIQSDDSADLKCQLHFAKEELALMCKKLTKLVSESEGMREELAKYHSTYGDIDATQSPEGKHNSAHTREAEVKVHLKLVEEEATLLSRRIVELEVENRGLRAEMSDLREKVGGGGGGGGGGEGKRKKKRIGMLWRRTRQLLHR
ncbi:hypothetical protein INR49_003524 [Caranx melampygus]|nr:hypothetical protein INR49_003524 [Caranx melampygus]